MLQLSDPSATLSLGQSRLYQELRFSNQDLRWKLQQRSQQLTQRDELLTRMKNVIVQQEELLDSQAMELKLARQEVMQTFTLFVCLFVFQ